MQSDLFSVANLAASVAIPPAPALVPHHGWPFPGLSPEDSARAGLSHGAEHADMLAAVVKAQGGAELTDGQLFALIPADWRELLGGYANALMCPREGEARGVRVRYVPHDGGGFHWTYQAV